MRIAVIGSSGSGKSTYARRVGAALNHPVVELDAVNWQAGWKDLASHDPAEFVRRVEVAIAGEAWVTDGNYSLAMPAILARASDVVWLDYGRGLIMRRVIGRSIVRSAQGVELWPGTGNREEWRRWFDKDHPIRWAWRTFRARRRRYEALMAAPPAGARFHRVRRPAEAEALLAKWRGSV